MPGYSEEYIGPYELGVLTNSKKKIQKIREMGENWYRKLDLF